MVGLEHRNMETGAGFPARVDMGGGRVAEAMFTLIFAAIVGAIGPASACEDAFNEHPSERRIDGNACSATIKDTQIGSADLSEVEDLGGGFVRQIMSDGSFCTNVEKDFLVQDCASGRVAIFGEFRQGFEWTFEGEAPPKHPSDDLSVLVEEAARKGAPLDIDQILKRASAAGLPYVLEAKTPGTIAINGHKFPLGCGCSTYYPDSKGARS